MKTTTQDSKFAWLALRVFAGLAVWVFVLKTAEQFDVLQPVVVSLLRLVPSLMCFVWLAWHSLRVHVSLAIRISFLIFVFSIFTEMILSVTEDVAAWDHVAVIGRASQTRRVIERVVTTGWFFSGFYLVVLMVKSLEQYRKTLEATVIELNDAQQQNIRRERLSALGQMASGIAHDLNNTLTPAVTYLEAVLADQELSAEQRRCCECALQANTHAAAVIKRLGQFYRGQNAPADIEPVDLKQLVSQIPLLTRPKWHDEAQLQGRSIEIRLDLNPVPPVHGSGAELRTVFTNLVFNAVDATPDGGVITLKLFPEGDSAVVEVSDTGIGMTDEQTARCFEPFFSTKNEKSGLGLSVCHGIVRQHGGNIEVRARAPHGSVVRVSLPTVNHDAADSAPVQASPSAFDSKLRCLYIEDDAAVRDAFATMFSVLGIPLDLVADGAAGLELVRAHDYDLVFTDLGMTGVDGASVVAAVKRARPHLPVVVISGWPREEVLEWFTGEEQPDHIIEKPATLKDIQEVLAAVESSVRVSASAKT